MAECFVTPNIETKFNDEKSLLFISEILKELKENKDINYNELKTKFYKYYNSNLNDLLNLVE